MIAVVAIRWLAVVTALCALCACGGPSLTRMVEADPQLPPTVELAATPFFPQVEYQCGPAALATVLAASGVAVVPDDLVAKVFVPALQGSLQTEMIAATRGYDRLAMTVEPQLDALLAALAEGHAVLVLQNLGVESVPFWHYAVVIGYDAPRGEVLLRSGTARRQRMTARRFLGAWQRAGNWGALVARPDDVPRSVNRPAFVAAAAGLEAAGRHEAALAAYHAALTRWPNDTTALLGIGNVHYAQGRLAEAEGDFRAVLSQEPGDAVARNNLAQVLLESGRTHEALREIELARKTLTDHRFTQALAETEEAIRSALANHSSPP